MIYFLIPARSGSKGFPGKNKKLFKYTANLVADRGHDVIVSSDDDEILKMAKDRGFTAIERPDHLARDTADMVAVLKHVVMTANLHDEDIIVLLYLTSPGRTHNDITQAFTIFYNSNALSLVCRTPAKSSPYMCIYADGSPVIQHDFYRRQDYPECFEIRHHVAIYRVSEIGKLNKLLFNNNTIWMDIPDPDDIDHEKDFLNFIENKI
jgi:CMP-N-acetylneuraminic acid synthetase